MRTRKFNKGDTFTHINDVITTIQREEWMYFLDKPMHHGFMVSMTLKTLLNMVDRRQLSRAVATAVDTV